MVNAILIIAGSDPSGGAGIQADLKTATAHKIYASAAIACLTAQSTKKVFAIHNSPLDFLHLQIELLLDDIKFDAIKIGMLGDAQIIDCVADILEKKAKKIPLILDPVMVATSGDFLLKKNAVETLKSRLIKSAKIITPNIDEAKILAEMEIHDVADMKSAALQIKALGCEAVLIKGGHLNFSDGKIHSILLDEKDKFHLISNKKIGKKNLHGTGCTLASALACNIAKKMPLPQAAKKANSYVHRCIMKSLKVGKGSLVLQHF
ncbi:MAG: bifunctional hydroxymethylpyrimidine kinase/phosphomethylpyrimidine kinase [Alphaproteobacteria bacterium RIFCSPLOWO2_01_FULL_40_26]|nr:MAG: bifunctional hydroxymethylpyrimidine kinase/phosphomethylpyrimidine kinase [Alphaproteobacteria bacterium RIFCSPHIGHO2_02_FULL_40_34]OFW86477.1 MAG: bifunctional hydroxymethylpyrimidine kinase/phosphomethylpyrimidine kinase [Alphaproteobacteria bacterium RIFCSPHIGHO2_01_FULL_40_8]OFW95315.1 MAG: bifunctional hydroxymethylpyrimidine kinase/phosphomethylpyrimidine kinase [Alphaproteobacteria bacterium RIFCSPLOWO2_01_FULL_40_26]OFX09218.1 MAG: bifunctional hydroxymethylpyrimidine kinase/pho